MGLVGLDGIYKAQAAILNLPRAMSQATTDAADLLEDVIEQQFDQGHDPYGEPWAPLQPSTLRRGRRPPPLTDEGALRAVRVDPQQHAGIVVAFDEDYAVFHQLGTSRMLQRRLVPDESTFQQSLWYQPIVEAYSNAFLKNGGWREGGASVTDSFDQAAE